MHAVVEAQTVALFSKPMYVWPTSLLDRGDTYPIVATFYSFVHLVARFFFLLIIFSLGQGRERVRQASEAPPQVRGLIKNVSCTGPT